LRQIGSGTCVDSSWGRAMVAERAERPDVTQVMLLSAWRQQSHCQAHRMP
jgi:hypothetical protein